MEAFNIDLCVKIRYNALTDLTYPNLTSPSPAGGTLFRMLPWLHLQSLHFSEGVMEVISIRENYFRESSFAEFSQY